MDVSDEKRRHRINIVIVAIVVAIIALIIFSVVMILQRKGDDGRSEDSVDTGLVFENYSFANSMLGGNLFAVVSSNLESVVMDGAEVEGDLAETYTAKINNSEVASKVVFPYSVSSFNFEVSDGRKYNVDIAANMPSYYGVLISRSEPKQETPKLFIVFLGSEKQMGYNRDSVISYLLGWAKKSYPKGVYLTTQNIF